MRYFFGEVIPDGDREVGINAMKQGLIGLIVGACVVASGCAIWPTWHWAKSGASEEQLAWDQNQCKARVYAGSSGNVTNETVRHMFACMEGKGWSRVGN